MALVTVTFYPSVQSQQRRGETHIINHRAIRVQVLMYVLVCVNLMNHSDQYSVFEAGHVIVVFVTAVLDKVSGPVDFHWC